MKAAFEPQHGEEVPDFVNDGVGCDHSRDVEVPTPDRVQTSGASASDIHLRVIADEDSPGGLHVSARSGERSNCAAMPANNSTLGAYPF